MRHWPCRPSYGACLGYAIDVRIAGCGGVGLMAQQSARLMGAERVIDKFPMGVIMNKGMTVLGAQQHGQAYMDRLLAHAQKGELNPAYLATHRFPLEDGPRGYDMFKHKKDGCVRAVFAP